MRPWRVNAFGINCLTYATEEAADEKAVALLREGYARVTVELRQGGREHRRRTLYEAGAVPRQERYDLASASWQAV